MGKHDKIAARFAGLIAAEAGGHHPCYTEYFRLFNEREYYAAHDVLEHLWLGSEGEQHTFYKALIQLAGGFVHLQHQHREPDHRIHGRRLRPAARLFKRCAELLEPLPDSYEGLDVVAIRALALGQADELARSGFTGNVWTPATAPRLDPPD